MVNPIAQFLDKYGERMEHHANYLDAAEQRAEYKRGEGVSDTPEGYYGRNAEALRTLFNRLQVALEGKRLETATPEGRAELRGQFTKAASALTLVVKEHAAFNGRLARGASEKHREASYRRNHFVPDGDELEEGAKKRIRRRAADDAKENKVISAEIVALIEMRDAMQTLQTQLLGSGRGGGEAPPGKRAGRG
ncbi:MAG: hypothetical protein EBV03_06675 [Proteobacteria bacterium]|nr:hypothetical protein [Pseudomonadota bacterium]